MLRRTIYALLVCAIILNIGAGIVYNGVPDELGRILEALDDGSRDDLTVTLPLARSGDHYVTSCNMTVDIKRSGDEGAVYGSLSQSGTLKRTLMSDRFLWELEGTQEMYYNSTETGELELTGDVSRSRSVSLDPDTGMISEERKTTLQSVGFMGPALQCSEMEMVIPQVRNSIEDLLWSWLVPENRTFQKASWGSMVGHISVNEVGLLLPTSVYEWYVQNITDDHHGRTARVCMEGPVGADITFVYLVLFSDGCPYPDSVRLTVRGSYRTDEGMAWVDLDLSEETRYYHPGSGSVISWQFRKGDDTQDPPFAGGLDGMVVSSGSGESSFYSTPEECLGTAIEKGSHLGDFIERYGEDGITTYRSVYYRNDTGLSGSRIWNITLCGPETDGITPALSFEVLTQPGGSSVLDRRKMELLSENEHILTTSPDPSRSMISLSDFEELLSTSRYSDRFMISRQYAPGMVLEIVNRGSSGASPFSTLLYNVVGMERMHDRDLFICHVPDIYDPMKIYILVIDGTHGRIVSETAASGFCTLLFSSYGLDLA
ncbi:MAG: hypothetical protein JXA22_05415 [Candidatus Thermoplasmatota archaeon]|nr:hypothetical protein [Candidatus Thermoplasmatota archaeon]